MNKADCVIRPMRAGETERLKDFLYEAIFIPEGATPPDQSILQLPELKVYVEDFGLHTGDTAYVAERNGRLIGAAWARIMHDYGHIDDDTPSLSIALYPAERGLGIGTGLLQALLTDLRNCGVGRVSLSVQKANPAVRMYRRLGFTVHSESQEAYIMVLPLDDNGVSGGVRRP